MKRIKLLSLLLTLWLTTPQAFAQAVNVQDSLALVDLYDSTNGPGWPFNSGWKNGPVNTWSGVFLTSDRVTRLNLSFNQLVGSIPESFGNLTKLLDLDLSFNQISSLPTSFGNLTSLESLGLNNNQLSSLPASFGNLTNLKSLSLYINQLNSLPASFGNLTNLTSLAISDNQLTSLPTLFGNLTKLTDLSLSRNQLTSLPESIGNLTNLRSLYLDQNQLNVLPNSFGNMKNLYYLSLSLNQLSSLPESIGNLNNLQTLSLDNNQLSALPDSIGKLRSLGTLSLANNKFTFAGLEWLIQAVSSFTSVTYAPQDTFKLTKAGNTLIAPVGGTPDNNTFYWYRDSKLERINKADSTYKPTIAGRYRVEVHNAIATQLTLYSEPLDYVPDCNNGACITSWFRDGDGDGFGNPSSSIEAKEQPNGYVSNNLDCDDKNKTKGGVEVCDGIDNDCDGIIDDGLPETTFYSDFDGDGYGSEKRTITACSPPPRYVAGWGDCNDDNATVYPGAPELCDGRDNDCNGTIDDGHTLKPFYWDGDKDGYGFVRPVYACAAPPGYIAQGGDCKDNNAAIYPGATEHCDGVDEDCDGVIDNGFIQKRFYKDKDGDGWGSNSNLLAGCAPKGYVENRDDCNDNNATIHPGAVEHCDGIDEDCNAIIDDGFTQKRFYKDKDGDGWGSDPNLIAGCAPPGYTEKSGDCNDSVWFIHPEAIESCNGIDDDCDGIIDNGFTEEKRYYVDLDNDGWGTDCSITAKCPPPFGYAEKAGDCNDFDSFINPGVIDQCDDIDNDCNGIVDDGLTEKRYYQDSDFDGWGSDSFIITKCPPFFGYVERTGDCNDLDWFINPGVDEVLGNGVDDNCNGEVDETIVTVNKKADKDLKEASASRLQLTAVPNPTQHSFTLRISSNSGKPVQLRVVDEVGRIVEARSGIPANGTLPIGHSYRQGVYIAEVLQEGRKAAVKLVKQAH
jgi:Leucine-rich repeat (LRR) protein